MYELVNTSVPNGLIAGTHGFATVAMTKGMPDAIRTRVENFCAYPHRTSAHDQSYFSENPVNWFHLVLPGGDHVVGRTAPAEFDYTGRTNRISRTLHFSQREMPQNGGAFVLASEAKRLSESWIGDPCYLPVDKVTAGRLQLANPPVKNPSNWVAMFGPQGAEYARGFALLLEQNLKGSNKGIYFKTSPGADSDGTRLLGLFSDLINLVPPELSAQVTFSTFCPCVPNGVVCHLRGIYDKDRAFETSSALQPWVDCENGCVKHADMLPKEVAPASSDDAPSADVRPTDWSVNSHVDQMHKDDLRRTVGYLKQKTNEVNNGRLTLWKLLWVIVGFVALLLAGTYFILGDDIKRAFESDKSLVPEKDLNEDKLSSWRTIHTNKIADIQQKINNCDSLLVVTNLSEQILGELGGLEKSLEETRCLNYDGVLQEIKRWYKQLLDALAEKGKELADKKPKVSSSEDDGKKKAEEDRKREADSARKAEEELEAAKKQQAEEQSKAMVMQSRVDEDLKDLKITDVIADDVDWLKKYKDSEKRQLTRKGCIAIWFCIDGVCKKAMVELVETKKTVVRSRKSVETFEYVLPKLDIGNSNWELVNIVVDETKRDVLWSWHDRWTEKPVFAEGKIEKNALIAACFGHEEAYYLWRQYMNNKVLFILEPVNPKVGYFYVTKAEKSCDVIEEWQKIFCAEYDKQIRKLEAELGNADSEKTKCEVEITRVAREVEKAREKFEKLNGMSSKEKKENAFGGMTVEQSLKKEIKEIMEPLLCKIKEQYNQTAIKNGIEKVEKKLCACRHAGGHDKAKIQELINQRKQAKEKKIDELKGAIYRIRVISELWPDCKMGWNTTKKMKSREE